MNQESKKLIIISIPYIIGLILGGLTVYIYFKSIPIETRPIFVETNCETNGIHGIYFSNINPRGLNKTLTNVYLANETGEWIAVDIEHLNYLKAIETCNHEVAHRINSSEEWAFFMGSGLQDYYYNIENESEIYTKYNGEFVRLQ